MHNGTHTDIGSDCYSFIVLYLAELTAIKIVVHLFKIFLFSCYSFCVLLLQLCDVDYLFIPKIKNCFLHYFCWGHTEEVTHSIL